MPSDDAASGRRRRDLNQLRHLVAAVGRSLDRVGAAFTREEVVERAVHLLAAESLLHLGVDLDCRPRVRVPDLAHDVAQRSSSLIMRLSRRRRAVRSPDLGDALGTGAD
jgi:hypothetical protein